MDINHVAATPNVTSSFYANNVKWDISFSENTWYFIVFTYDGGDAAATNRKLYVNGVPRSGYGTGGGSGQGFLDIPANRPVAIGGFDSPLLQGDLAYYGIWSRVIPSAEVSSMWTGTKGYFGL